MSISLKANPDGVSGTIQVNGVDKVTIPATGPVVLVNNAQTWQNVTGSTISGTPKTNTSTIPIKVSAFSTSAINTAGSVQIAVGALLVAYNYAPAIGGASTVTCVTAEIPAGASYAITWTGTGQINELK